MYPPAVDGVAMAQMRADGSAFADSHPTVTIDRAEEPYRWVCPNGHASWDRTNNHVWCVQCRRALESNAMIKVAQAEHYEIVDKKTNRTIPYEAVEFEEDDV
jgi:hypothetical protein